MPMLPMLMTLTPKGLEILSCVSLVLLDFIWKVVVIVLLWNLRGDLQ